MHKMEVSGEMRAIAAREGSSGVFAGSIAGLYQGYRFASTTPDEQEYTLEAPHGTIALVLRQQIVTPLPPRPAEHPFANGNDPFETLAAGGPPTGRPSGAGAAPPAHPPSEAPGMEGGHEIFKRVHYMEVTTHVVPEKSTGIFAGATGQMEILAPAYQMAGYLVVDTPHGELRMTFLEAGSREKLNADLWVDGENSTGIWQNARGELQFSLTIVPPFYGRGPYSGTIWLENEPPAA